MAEFFFNYGLFALKFLTAVALLGVLIAFVGASLQRPPQTEPGTLQVTQLNDTLKHHQNVLRAATQDRELFRFEEKQKKQEEKRERKERKATLKKHTGESPESQSRPRLFVLDFQGDLQASALSSLRREITALLEIATPRDEIVVRLESGGGLVHSYGLAAAQLQRIRDHQVKLTVCVDKIAASGGYMMACVADQILAAPFAVLGSIGVVAQIPNIHRLLKKHDVDVELLTAGEHKRTLTVLGENTEQGRKKFLEDLEETHQLFKSFVQERRPELNIQTVATGEVWYGQRALEEKLIDRIQVSDEYLAQACKNADVFEVRYIAKKSFQEKLAANLESSLEHSFLRLWQRSTQRRGFFS